MPQNLLTGPHALILLLVVVLLFGASRLPQLARSIGQSMKIFKNEIKSDTPKAGEESAPAPAQSVATPAAPAAPAHSAEQPPASGQPGSTL